MILISVYLFLFNNLSLSSVSRCFLVNSHLEISLHFWILKAKRNYFAYFFSLEFSYYDNDKTKSLNNYNEVYCKPVPVVRVKILCLKIKLRLMLNTNHVAYHPPKNMISWILYLWSTSISSLQIFCWMCRLWKPKNSLLKTQMVSCLCS